MRSRERCDAVPVPRAPLAEPDMAQGPFPWSLYVPARVFFFLDYLAVMILFAVLGREMTRLLQKKKR